MPRTREELRAAINAEVVAFTDRIMALFDQAPAPVPPPPLPTQACITPEGLVTFFDGVRATEPLGPALSPQEVQGCERIIRACAGARWPASWAAYALATSFHETDGLLAPRREYGRGKGKAYGVPGPHGGQVPYGRGDVQLTWPPNYAKMDEVLGLNGALVANYDLALDPEISARILVAGMEHGIFTGKKLADYLPAEADIHQFANARRVVNKLDKAALIAEYAVNFQAALKPAWRC